MSNIVTQVIEALQDQASIAGRSQLTRTARSGWSIDVRVGEPDGPALEAANLQFMELSGGIPLPETYRQLMGFANGIEVSMRGNAQPFRAVNLSELREPQIWPVSDRWDPMELAGEVTVPGGRSVFLIGEIPDAGWISIEAGGEGRIFWHDREIAHTEPFAISSGIDEFLSVLVAAGFDPVGVLKARSVPGWSG